MNPLAIAMTTAMLFGDGSSARLPLFSMNQTPVEDPAGAEPAIVSGRAKA
jgi:hypothetical protein